MKTIDVHTHAFPNALAERAIAKLEAEAECPWKAFGTGRIADLLESMDVAGVDVSVVCAIATKPDQAEGILKWCDGIRSDRIAPFPSVHPETPGAGQWVQRIVGEGFRGIKLHAMYQQFAIDDPLLDEIYAAAEACGAVIAFHCGRDIAFPMDDDRAEPRRLARVIERFGDLKIIATHMGGWRMWDESDELLVGRNVYFETSFSLPDLAPDRIVDMMHRHGMDRVLFGSDWPWARQDADVAGLRRLALDSRDLRGILSANAAKLLAIDDGAGD